jgi:mRNA interferase RelE/StbE
VWEVRIAPAAAREIADLSPVIQTLVLDVIAGLALNPRPAGCRKISGLPPNLDVYRVSAGRAHRIIYQVKDEAAWILVVKVADRKDVYKRVQDLKRSLD